MERFIARILLLGAIGFSCVLYSSVSVQASLPMGTDYTNDFSSGQTDADSAWNVYINYDQGAQLVTEINGIIEWSWTRGTGDTNGYTMDVSFDIARPPTGGGKTQLIVYSHSITPQPDSKIVVSSIQGESGKLKTSAIISPEDNLVMVKLTHFVTSTSDVSYWDNMAVDFQPVAMSEPKSPWVDARSYNGGVFNNVTISAAITDIGSTQKTLLLAPGTWTISSNVTVPSNINLKFEQGAILSIGTGWTFTINGSLDAPLSQIFSGVGTVSLGSGYLTEVYSEWWGAKADDSTDCITAMTKAVTACGATKTLRLIDGIYRISSVLNAYCAINGNSPYTSIIYNTGTGDGLYLPGTYTKTWMDFSVKGNSNSRDGITLYTQAGDNNAYSSFQNVYSYQNGRHGLYHRNAWATKYINCKFSDNGGLGIFLDTQTGDPGTHNGVSFINCESRHNGGTATNTTYNDDKGGVKIVGAAMVAFIGGIYESNNAWGFIISNQGTFATRNIHIKNVYMEATPNGANIGGSIYMGGIWENVTVEQSWISYGNGPGKTGYCFYIDRTLDQVVFKEVDNFTVASGSGGTDIRSYGKTHDQSKVMVSPIFGDTGASGIATNTTILTVSNDGKWMVSGFIHAKRNSNSPGGVYAFIASRDSTSARAVSVGSKIAGGTVTTAPTMSFSGDNLQVNLATYHYAFVEVKEQIFVGNEPTTFDWSPTLFGTMVRRR